MSKFEEKTIKTEHVYAGKIISVQIDDVQLPNGKRGKRELVKHPGAVAVMPFTVQGNMILIRQYRKPLEKEIFEIPAGKLEPNEDPLTCALRELEEETGYTADQLRFITSFYTSPGFADEKLYLYEAKQLVEGQASPDEDEFVEKVEVSLEAALRLMKEEKIHDAKTAYAILYWQLQTQKDNGESK